MRFVERSVQVGGHSIKLLLRQASPPPPTGGTAGTGDDQGCTGDTQQDAECRHDEDLLGLDLWPASVFLARHMAAGAATHLLCPGAAATATVATVVELGAGSGLPGLTAAAMGCGRVVLSDYSEKVLQVLADVIRANGLSAPACTAERLDWASEAPVLRGGTLADVTVAADVLYLSRLAPLLANAVDAVTAPRGCLLLGHTLRRAVRLDRETGAVVEDEQDEPLEAFKECMAKRGWGQGVLLAEESDAATGGTLLLLQFTRDDRAGGSHAAFAADRSGVGDVALGCHEGGG